MSSAARQNRQLLLEQQQRNLELKRREAAQMRRESNEIAKTQAQYKHVPSRVGAPRGSVQGPSAAGMRDDDVEIKVYVRECDEDQSHFFRYKESEGAPADSGKPSSAAKRTPSAKKSAPGAKRSPSAKKSTSKAAPSSASGVGGAPNKGKVPKYLQERKAEMAAEKQAVEDEKERRKELAKIPPGHRLVSEEEKAETLERLAERKTELELELRKIPLRFDTVSIQNKRKAIDDELEQIENTMIKYKTKGPLYVRK